MGRDLSYPYDRTILPRFPLAKAQGQKEGDDTDCKANRAYGQEARFADEETTSQ